MKVPNSNFLILCAVLLLGGVMVVFMTANNANSETRLPVFADSADQAGLDPAPAAARTRSGVPPIDAAQPAQYATATFAVG